MFQIDVSNLHWIDNTADDPDDLCLHGDVIARVGEEVFEDSATVSSTALYLLKTLTENHMTGESNQMLPCCGHTLIANEQLDNVDIIGCPNGIDWSVIHEGDMIKIITESNRETFVDKAEYRKDVYRFADTIEAFYKKCSPKIFSDEFDKNGYTAFWNEWNRRRA